MGNRPDRTFHCNKRSTILIISFFFIQLVVNTKTDVYFLKVCFHKAMKTVTSFRNLLHCSTSSTTYSKTHFVEETQFAKSRTFFYFREYIFGNLQRHEQFIKILITNYTANDFCHLYTKKYLIDSLKQTVNFFQTLRNLFSPYHFFKICSSE